MAVACQYAAKRGKCPGCGQVIHVPTADAAYVQDCFDPHLGDNPDPRHWSQLPGAKEIAAAGNSGDWSKVARLATDFVRKEGTHGFGYYWLARSHRALGQHDRARQCLSSGLSQASTFKYMLCLQMGDLEWDLDDLEEAVRWWTKSVVVQVRSKNFDLAEHSAFLYLSYVAEGLGLDDAPSSLRRKVDAIRAGQIRLDPGPATNLVSEARRCASSAVRLAVERVAAEFCATRKESAGSASTPAVSLGAVPSVPIAEPGDANDVERVARLVGYLRQFRQNATVEKQPEYQELLQIGEKLNAHGGYTLMSRVADEMAPRVTAPPNPWVGDQVRDSMSDITEYWRSILDSQRRS